MNRNDSLQLVLQIHQQIDDLRLNRHIQRGHRFVADDQLRIERQRARDADALALAAGEFVRIRLHQRSAAARRAGTTRRLSLAAPPGWRRRRWMISGSPTISPADMRGLSDA